MEQLSEFQRKLRELDLKLAELMVRPEPRKTHHTSGDWDFDSIKWNLDSSLYVSPPSSMHFTASPNHAKIKTTTVPISSVKEGRVVTWLRANSTEGVIRILLRWQDADNLYCVSHPCGTTFAHSIMKIKAGVITTLRSATANIIPANTWKKLRATWWNDYVGLVIRSEYWNGSAWVKCLEDGYDSENLWKTTGGRVGLGHPTRADYWWVDDTEIYGIDP